MRPRLSSYPLLRMRKPLPSTVESPGPFPSLPPAKKEGKSFPLAKHVHPLSPLPKRTLSKATRTSLPLEALRAGLQQSKSAMQSPRVEVTQEIGHPHRKEVIHSNLKAQFYTTTRKPPQKSPNIFQSFRTFEAIASQPLPTYSAKSFCRSLPIGRNSIYYQEDRKTTARPVLQLSIHPILPLNNG